MEDDFDPDWKNDHLAYRIAERMVMGEEYYAPGYMKEIPEDKKRLIGQIKNELLAKCLEWFSSRH